MHASLADTIVPGGSNPLAFNRYAYTYNQPVNFSDPTGHVPAGVGPCIDGLYCGDDPTGDHAGDVLNPGFDQSGVQAWKRHKRIQEAHAQNAAAAAAAAAGPYQNADSQYVPNQPYQPATSQAQACPDVICQLPILEPLESGCRLWPCIDAPQIGNTLSDINVVIDGFSLGLSLSDWTQLDRQIGGQVFTHLGAQAGPQGVVIGAVFGPLAGEVIGDQIGNELDRWSGRTALAADIINDNTGWDNRMNALVVGEASMVDGGLSFFGSRTNSGAADTALNSLEFVGYDILRPRSDIPQYEGRLHLGPPFISIGPVSNRYDHY